MACQQSVEGGGLAGGGATRDLLRRPEGAEGQVDMERVCQQLASTEPHRPGALMPVLTAFPSFHFFPPVNVVVVVVDPGRNKVSAGWSQRVTQGEPDA